MALFSFFAKCLCVGEDGPGQGRLCHTDTFLVSSVFSLSIIFFLPCPFFISSAISFISLLPFSGRWHKMTHKGWRVVKPQHKCMLKLLPLHNGGKISDVFLHFICPPWWLSLMRVRLVIRQLWVRPHRLGNILLRRFDHEIFSTVLFLLIQEGQLTVSGERMCSVLANRLED